MQTQNMSLENKELILKSYPLIFTTLKELNFKVIEHSFPDHYQFTEDDLTFSEQLPIVMTEKDAARCHKIQVKNIWILKIEAELPDEFALQLVNEIKEKVK